MSKRKAGLNDIIYELDNDDVEISSDEENKVSKIICLDENERPAKSIDSSSKTSITLNVIKEDKDSAGGNENILNPLFPENGGKATLTSNHPTEFTKIDLVENTNIASPNTIVFDDDIVVDSPLSNSNSDLGVVGCENKTPLVTVKFKDKKLASAYKKKVKAFMLELIKLHDKESLIGSETDTDLELDIWPEDLTEYYSDKNEDEENDLFFVDTVPSVSEDTEIPQYQQVSAMISNLPQKEPTPPPVFHRLPTCFNCDGSHPLRDCKLPRNNIRIAEKRKNIAVKLGRYHVEDEQKYGHLVPGRISGPLRHALGLKRHELPVHIYRMRELGYPPGWLEEARIKHSGITMFDSSGNAILEPDEEEGEVCDPGSKDKFDIKKILDFPGFNVPASSRYKEEAYLFGLPPMSEQDSKMAMLQLLAPNAMKAYKRKKLTFFPSASADSPVVIGQAEMDLDSGDEETEFPSVPPLPDELPPPPPPPPDTSPPDASSPLPPPEILPPPIPPETSPLSPADKQPLSTANVSQLPSTPNSPLPAQKSLIEAPDDLEIVEVTEIIDIPVPSLQCITIDDDDDKSQLSSGRDSPTLDALEEKKRLLLTALESDEVLLVETTNEPTVDKEKCSVNSIMIDKKCDNTIDKVHVCNQQESTSTTIDEKVEKLKEQSDKNNTSEISCNNKDEDPSNESKSIAIQQNIESVANVSSVTPESVTNYNAMAQSTSNNIEINKTMNIKTGQVRTTSYGTPVMNIASSFVKLPNDENFAKDICDVINFENLPNSTGKFKKIRNFLKKVKSEVDRIQES